MKVPGRVEVGVGEPSQDDFARSHGGHFKLSLRTFQAPSLLGDLDMTGAAQDGLVRRSFNLGPARAAHAAGLDVVDLQVSGGATDLTSGIGANQHCLHHIYIISV